MINLMTRNLLFLLLFILFARLGAQGQLSDTTDYYGFSVEAMHLGYTKNYDSMAVFLENALSRYPEKKHEILANLVIINLIGNKGEKALEHYINAIQEGLFLGINEDMIPVDSLPNKPLFDSLLAIDKARLNEKQKNCRPEYYIELPALYHPDSLFPLFIVLHEWGQNARELMDLWTSPWLRNNFLVAFVQSSQLADMDGYHWGNKEQAVSEILTAYHEICDFYPVDTTSCVIGGYGQGGEMAIYLLLEQLIPLKGFITVSPSKPENFTTGNVKRAREKRQRAVIVAGMLDPAFSGQAEMIGTFRSQSLLYRFSPRKTNGREIPSGFDQYIRKGLLFLGYKE